MEVIVHHDGPSQLERDVRTYLDSLPYILWGTFNIADEKGKDAAVQWLVKQIRGVQRIAEKRFLEKKVKSYVHRTQDTTISTENPGATSQPAVLDVPTESPVETLNTADQEIYAKPILKKTKHSSE